MGVTVHDVAVVGTEARLQCIQRSRGEVDYSSVEPDVRVQRRPVERTRQHDLEVTQVDYVVRVRSDGVRTRRGHVCSARMTVGGQFSNAEGVVLLATGLTQRREGARRMLAHSDLAP